MKQAQDETSGAGGQSDSTAGVERTVSGYSFEKIDDFEIRMVSPSGEAWRLRYADKNDGFAKFIWDFAVAVSSNPNDFNGR